MKTKSLYVILVITVITITVVNQSIIQWSIEKNKSYSTVINIAGRQRMLGQKIMKELYQAEKTPSILDSMKASMKLWNEVHIDIQSGNDNLPPITNDIIIRSFETLNPIQRKLHQKLLAVSQNNIVEMDIEKLDLLENQYYEGMNEIVFLFEKEAKQKLINIGIIELTLTIVSIVIILLEILYIFRPSFRKIVEAEYLKRESKRLYDKNMTISKLNQTLEKKNQELQENKSMLQSLIDNVPLMLAILDKNGKILRANDKFFQLFNLDQNATLKNDYHYYDVLPRKVLMKHRNLIINGLGGVSSRFEDKVLFRDKKWFYGYGVYEPIFQNGIVTGLTVFVADITELKVVQEKLTRINDVKTKLFNVISHDLKGPVASLKGVMELLFGDLISEKEFKELSSKLYNNVNYLYHTIETLFHWTYLQLDQISTIPSSINISRFITVLIDHLHSTAKNKSVSIVNNIDNTATVFADFYQLKIVFNNIFTNAIKFSHADQEIMVELDVAEEYVDIVISDKGVGMDDETISKIFSVNRYYTSLGTNKERGIGLGIPLCIQLLKCNNGRLLLKSRVGEGTVVKVRLPTPNSLPSSNGKPEIIA